MTSDQLHDAEPAAPAMFPDAVGRQKGYEKRAVDAFLAGARAAFEGGTGSEVTSATVREATFPIVKHGYSIVAVDAAMGRIEDAFAAREREDGIADVGVEGWVERARGSAQEILDRLGRPDGRRFDRAGGLRYGYRIDEVDLVARKLIGYFERGEPVTADQVRQAAFRMQRRGYREEQVDALLDAVVEVMLAVG
ncbi:MAG: DivIVA domain-containing protein [Microbacterium sp.]|uniref:DivIVA domain-containing protein n=1 Tax=Microbacterium sp. TaxID=51671 RepID=UPI0039E2C543